MIGLGHDTVVFNTTVCCKKSIYLRFILTLRGSDSLKSAKYIFLCKKDWIWCSKAREVFYSRSSLLFPLMGIVYPVYDNFNILNINLKINTHNYQQQLIQLHKQQKNRKNQ